MRAPGTFTRLLIALLLAVSAAARAQDVQHLAVPQEGGLPGLPILTGVNKTTNGLTITWDGPSGYYQLFQKQHLNDSKWLAVGKATNLNRQATVSTTLSNAFFVVSGPTPKYAGSQSCAECHASVLNTFIHTSHAGAFTNAAFAADGGQTNSSCLACHTVAYGLPTGFATLARTPKLADVQCENCHGPAANHAANPDDPTLVPRVEIASTLCGGCHATRYAEWKTSGHTRLIPDLSAPSQLNNCGRCHSGSVRESLVQGLAPVAGDASLAIECSVCHDPHQTNGYTAQLRYPLASTNDYFMPTNGAFATYYNPKVSVCAQCHNHAGASWTSSAAPPHLSPQYNMLLGTVGELAASGPHYQPGSHATLLTNQCVSCHMQTSPGLTPALLGVTGHAFTVNSYNVCLNCHPFPELLAQYAQASVSNQVQQVKLDLDYWAAQKAPATLYAKYGNRAWEYTTPGLLSPGGPGPDAAEQRLLSTNIQKARFNIYMVLSDGSLGLHNPLYAVALLEAADNFIYNDLHP